MPPSLVDVLTAELLVQVAAHVDHQDLPALRLSCRLMAATAHDEFGTAFFANRKHLWTAQSLDVMAEICAQASLARYITSIEFRVVDIRIGRRWSTRTASKFVSHTEVRRKGEQVARRYKLQMVDPKAEQGGKQSLRQAFCYLAKIGVVPRIAVTGTTKALGSLFGFRALTAVLGPKVSTGHFVEGTPFMLIEAAVETLLATTTPTTELRLGTSKLGLHPAAFYYYPHGEKATSIRQACRNLKSLEICFRGGRGLPDSGGSMRNLSTVFTAATSLERLSLSMSDSINGLSGFPEFFPVSQLKILQLTGVVASSQDYIRAYRHYAESLKTLSLTNVTMSELDRGCWRKVVKWMSENLSLNSMELARLMIENDNDGRMIITAGCVELSESDGHTYMYLSELEEENDSDGDEEDVNFDIDVSEPDWEEDSSFEDAEDLHGNDAVGQDEPSEDEA